MAHRAAELNSECSWDVVNSRIKAEGSGNSKRFEDGEALWAACYGYLQWTVENPIETTKTYADEGDTYEGVHKHLRPPTINGLCAHLGVHKNTFNSWAKEGARDFRKDLAPVIELVRNLINEEKFSGAAAGIYNVNLMIRDLGLSDSFKVDKPDEKITFEILQKAEEPAIYAHPDDPLGDSGWLFTREQLDAGIPFPGGSPAEPDVGEDKDATGGGDD